MKFKLLKVLLFINTFDAIVSCSIEQVAKETVENKMKNLVLLKRELSDSADDDTSEVFGSLSDRDLIYNMFKPERAVKVSVSTTTSTTTSTTSTTTEMPSMNDSDDPRNCSCRPQNDSASHHNPSHTELTRDDERNIYIVEKQYDEEKHYNKKKEDKKEKQNEEDKEEEDQEETSTIRRWPIKTTLRPIPTNTHLPNYQKELHEAQYVIKELEDQIDTAIRELCPNYKKVPDLDVHRMADVWQLSYYKADETLACFKIFIKKTSPQSRRRYENRYSNFNDTVNWYECLLELVSTGKLRDDRKHFLQATKSDKGILDNIIISELDNNENKIITLQEQTPDQWLVTHNLLLMRDCGSGNVVIFTRVPSKPTWDEVERAMNLFGENGVNGTEPCDVRKDDDDSEDLFRYKKYHIIS